MRYTFSPQAPPPKRWGRRVVTKTLILPAILINSNKLYEFRWLEGATIGQHYFDGSWKSDKWLDTQSSAQIYLNGY